jgi:hypothetical protein
MKQGIGFSQTISIMSIFIVITFALLSATLSYYKAFKVNSYIAQIVQKYEGYNSLSEKEIITTLSSLGYRYGSVKCPDDYLSKGGELVSEVSSGGKQHAYCLYTYEKKAKNGYFKYGILTYIFVDLPLGFKFKLPVYSETESIYIFNG